MSDLPRLPTNDTLPPGRSPLPHWDTFIARLNMATKAYRYTFDEAAYDNIENMQRMRLDPVIMDPLRTRQRSLTSLSWHIEPEDGEDQFEIKCAAAVEKRIRRMPQLAAFLLACKEDIWFGRSGCQVQYRWQNVDDTMGITPVGSIPVNADKLVYLWDGQVGIRVGATYPDAKVIGDYGFVHILTPQEREAFVIGIFEPEDMDFRKPQKAGAIKGLGLRERLYWWWGLKNQAAKYLADYLQWFAQGLTVYYYDGHNASAKSEAQTRIQQHQGLPFLLWPHWGDERNNFRPVERIQADSASASFLQNLLDYYDRQIRSMILGQMASTQPVPGGLGNGVAAANMVTADQVVKYDALSTQDYLTSDLVRVIYDYTYPGVPCGKWVFEIDSPNVDQLCNSIDLYTRLGGKVGSESLRKELGIPDLKTNETPLGQIDTLDPTALRGAPADTPVVQGQ